MATLICCIPKAMKAQSPAWAYTPSRTLPGERNEKTEREMYAVLQRSE
jgi:hypothetical protein